ncbi:MAG: tRNA (guanosine(46)-N7)-methyltransferase TrmB [Dermatophilaceae bacterium]
MPTPPVLDRAQRDGVRTFTPRWRRSPLTSERMASLLPARGLPAGPVVPSAAFGRVGPVVLEIGSGYGASAIAYAAAHPASDVLAVEVHVPGVARMLAAAEREQVRNLWVHCGDAMPLLRERLAPRSLDAVHLFFPDPWPKRRHAKRRFVQHHTLDLVASRLRHGGHLLVATDHAAHTEHVRRQFAHHGGWDVVEGERPGWRPDDGFEAKGVRAGRAIAEFRCTVR